MSMNSFGFHFPRSLFWVGVTAMVMAGCSQKSPSDDDGPAAEPTVPVTTGPMSTDVVPSSTVDGPSQTKVWECQLPSGDVPNFLPQIGCETDFQALASIPTDASISGARAVKTVVDRDFENNLYFQNSQRYQIHWEFASDNLSVANGFSLVQSLGVFNQEEYYSPNRRFVLGSLTHYEGPDAWVYEISPYDTASAEMIQTAYELISQNAFIGDQLRFHLNSEAVKVVAQGLPETVKTITTEELFEGVTYQPLNIAESYGQLRFVTAANLENEYVTFRDIVVLDRVPNDISVTLGIITEQFQTPLAHINVLAQNRGIPNMGLKGAFSDEQLRSLEGKWVRLSVGPSAYEIEEVSQEVADAWWAENSPSEVQVPGMDLEKQELADIQGIVQFANSEEMLAAIKEATRAYGGKAANYSVVTQIEGVPTLKAFAVPVYYYMQFMQENGFDLMIEEMLEDPEFQNDPAVRDTKLEELRDAMKLAPLNADFEAMLMDKLATEYAGIRMRFRSSTNAEDLDGFTGAGLYTSKSGDPNDPNSPVADAIRKVWASVWFFRAFEERSYRRIDHRQVGMALLVHRSFPEEEANGVALTNNPLDKSNNEPAFYINVQVGDDSVVLPPAGVTTDQILLYYDNPNKTISYLSYSNQTTDGNSVLTNAQVYELGEALAKIREFFAPAYAPASGGWWAMDTEFKFDGEPGEEPLLYMKQARPFGNR